MIMRFMSQIIVSAMRLKNMSPPSVNEVARFLSPTGSGVLPRTLPSVILPVGLAAVTFAEVAVNGAVSAVILLHDVGVVGTIVGLRGPEHVHPGLDQALVRLAHLEPLVARRGRPCRDRGRSGRA